MSNFDEYAKKAGKTAKKMAKDVAKGAAKLTDSAAMAVKIKMEESKLKCDYAELGRLSVEYFAASDSIPESIAEAIDAIKAQKKVIKKLKNEAQAKK